MKSLYGDGEVDEYSYYCYPQKDFVFWIKCVNGKVAFIKIAYSRFANSQQEEVNSENPPINDDETVLLGITKKELYDMFANGATFEELKDEYELTIDSESSDGNFLHVRSDKLPGWFEFMKMNGSDEFQLGYIKVPAYMILPQYVDMTPDEIPIVLETGGKRGEVLFMGDDYFSYSVSTSDALYGDNWVNVEKRHYIYG